MTDQEKMGSQLLESANTTLMAASALIPKSALILLPNGQKAQQNTHECIKHAMSWLNMARQVQAEKYLRENPEEIREMAEEMGMVDPTSQETPEGT